jgi:hydroxymethylpyrimidine pyrophosphatase-like HAD family hydrolase
LPQLLTPKKATKAEGIRRLKELLHCDKVIAFGDAANDIPMFEIADECYAVENAAEELKTIANGVIESNDNDGVAKWLQAHIRQKSQFAKTR